MISFCKSCLAGSNISIICTDAALAVINVRTTWRLIGFKRRTAVKGGFVTRESSGITPVLRHIFWQLVPMGKSPPRRKKSPESPS